MKLVIASVMLFTLVFFSAGIAKADDIAEMKEQIKALQETINTLNSKINTLETKQESQAKEIKKVPELTQSVTELKEKPANNLLDGMNVGGHLKFTLLDRTEGQRNGVDQHNNLSGGIYGYDNFFLFLSKNITDWLRVDVYPQWDITASATPALGSDIGRATSTSTSTRLYQAFMTVQLPRQYQLKAGTFNVMYSEDYAKETWWHQLYNLPLKLCTLVSWHDSGVELYKSFDFDKWSLPAYFSVLGGNTDRNIDNNDSKTVLLHLAPEFFQGKLRLLGTVSYGKWDGKNNQDAFRNNIGFEWKYKKFNLLGEYMYWEKKNVLVPSSGTVPTADGVNKGYWIRAMYNINPKWRALIQQSYSNLYQAGLSSTQRDMLSDKYYVTTLGLDFSLTPNSTIIGQYDKGNGHRSNGSESLKYDRFTLGWRTTF